MAYVYILKLQNGKYYIGSCRNLNKRMKQHRNKEVKSTKHNLPSELVYTKEYPNYFQARTAELRIKSWKRRKSIENLCKHDLANFAEKFGPVV
ncbi:GIY-YIG nuclease family protein [Patescibacteria group bacterium]|nr:GIY-YIG nuclease family protein [Patescibacteria group bacterium]